MYDTHIYVIEIFLCVCALLSDHQCLCLQLSLRRWRSRHWVSAMNLATPSSWRRESYVCSDRHQDAVRSLPLSFLSSSCILMLTSCPCLCSAVGHDPRSRWWRAVHGERLQRGAGGGGSGGVLQHSGENLTEPQPQVTFVLFWSSHVV